MRFLLLISFVLAAPTFATSQPDPPPLTLPGDVPPVAATGPSRVDRLVDAALSPAGLASFLSLVGAVLGAVAGGSVVRKRRIAKAVAAAYHLVEAVSSETTTPLDDKAAEGLKQLDRYLLTQGWREASEDEKARALLEFKVQHGEDARAETIAATPVLP